MNVEIGAEAALFPEKEYINGIAVAVQPSANIPVYLGFRFMYLSRRSDSEVFGLIFPVDILNEKYGTADDVKVLYFANSLQLCKDKKLLAHCPTQ